MMDLTSSSRRITAMLRQCSTGFCRNCTRTERIIIMSLQISFIPHLNIGLSTPACINRPNVFVHTVTIDLHRPTNCINSEPRITVTSPAQSNLGKAASQSPQLLQWDVTHLPPNLPFPIDDLHPNLIHPI